MVDWNDCYVRGDTPWDKGAASPVLEELLIDHTPIGVTVIPGCGLGNDVQAALAARAERVYAVDSAAAAIAVLSQTYGNKPSVYPVENDFFAWSLENLGIADYVLEHTCFCAIPVAMRPLYVDSVWRVLKPGGRLLAAFYWRPRPVDDILLGPPFQTDKIELEGLFTNRFTIEHLDIATVGFSDRLGREIMAVITKR